MYDLKKDPWETKNLIDSTEPAHEKAKVRLRAALDTWMYETNDQGRFPEDPSIAEMWDKRMEKTYGKWLRETDPEAYERMKEYQKRYREEAKRDNEAYIESE